MQIGEILKDNYIKPTKILIMKPAWHSILFSGRKNSPTFN